MDAGAATAVIKIVEIDAYAYNIWSESHIENINKEKKKNKKEIRIEGGRRGGGEFPAEGDGDRIPSEPNESDL